jgi:hypothetical protein
MSSQGLRECASQITNSINNRIYDRNIPSQTLQPYLNVRPVMTKYSTMPIVDPRAPVKTPLIKQPTYNSNNVFNPGTRQAPWSGFATNINTESELRNQIYALQSCSQAVYVPSTDSDLYNFGFKTKSDAQQPFPGLFQKDYFNSFNPNPENVGQGLFQNHTRQEIRGLGNDISKQNACNNKAKQTNAPNAQK